MSDADEDYSDDEEEYEDEDFGSESAQEEDGADKQEASEGGGDEVGGDQNSVEQSNDESQQPLDWDVNTFSSVPAPKELSDQCASENDAPEEQTGPGDGPSSPQLQSLDTDAQDKEFVSPSKPRGDVRDSRSDFNDITGEDALRQKVWEASSKLVREGEKNVSLALELEKCTKELTEVRGEIEQFSKQLLRGINGGVADVDNYRHIPLGELLRLRLQEADQASPVRDTNASTNMSMDTAKNIRKDDDKAAEADSIGGVQKLERELASEQQKSAALEKKCAALHEKLSSSGRELQEVGTLRQKITKLVERSRTERDLRARAEKEVSISNEKVEVLSDHIEKLMVHLKHEAISKVRALNDLSRANREVDLLQARSQTMAKRNARKDQAIEELKEGAKILEDQLKLMDEKYMELRLKLDWTRTQTQFTVKKKEEELQHLRSKFALLTELMPRGDRKKAPLLDEVDFGEISKSKQKNGTTAASSAKAGALSPPF